MTRARTRAEVTDLRGKLADRVVPQVGNALDLPYPDQTFDIVWCQNVTMNISNKARFLAGVYRVLKPGGLFTATEYSIGPGGDIDQFLGTCGCDADAISYGRLPHSRMDELLR